jgi:hypothetical protein
MCNHNNKQEMARHQLQEVCPLKNKTLWEGESQPTLACSVVERALSGWLAPSPSHFLSRLRLSRRRRSTEQPGQGHSAPEELTESEKALLRCAESSTRILKTRRICRIVCPDTEN